MSPGMEAVLIRALRTFLQAFVASLIGNAFLATKDLASAWTVLIGAALAGLVALLSFVQNWLEKATNAPERMRG